MRGRSETYVDRVSSIVYLDSDLKKTTLAIAPIVLTSLITSSFLLELSLFGALKLTNT